MRATFALLFLVLATAAGCCGPRPIRDRWCDAWNGRRDNHNHAQAPCCEYQQQAPCCGGVGGEMVIGP
jgi:hypothetical protein